MPTLENVTAALATAVGEDRAEEVLRRFGNFSNQPNTVKGAAKLPSDPELERAALRVFDDPSLDGASGLVPMSFLSDDPTQELWGLLTLATRADASVLDRLPEPVLEGGGPKIASIRRAATKHRKQLQAAADAPAGDDSAPSSSDAPALPAKVSEVAKWLEAHPDADPRLFAPQQGQRAAARRSALRALGGIATPAALDVLAEYASDSYSDVDLSELHRAWGRFDRREFAARMFKPGRNGVRLDVCSSIEGIGAVEGLRALDVILEKHADLTPLAECTELRELRVHATIGSGLTSIAAVAQLPQLTRLELIGITRGADLTVLRGTPIEQLYLHLDGADGSFLTELPQLRGLKLSGGYEPHPDIEEPAGAPDPTPAHPGLGDTVVELARAGVAVALYRHESWVPPLVASAPAGVDIEEAHGFVRLTRGA